MVVCSARAWRRASTWQAVVAVGPGAFTMATPEELRDAALSMQNRKARGALPLARQLRHVLTRSTAAPGNSKAAWL